MCNYVKWLGGMLSFGEKCNGMYLSISMYLFVTYCPGGVIAEGAGVGNMQCV